MSEQHTASMSQSGAARPPAGMPVIVNVLARTKADGSVGFSHTWRWDDGTPGGSGRIDIPARGKDDPGTPMHFHLKDETEPRRGLVFTDDEEGPMWVLRDQCPPDGQRCEDPEMPAADMKASPNLLRVFNKNSEQCTLHYRLRFKDRKGAPEDYDPDIRNGGTN